MKKIFLTALVACVLATPLTASAQQWFDFNGQALLPAGVGGDLTMYAVINNNGQIDTPLPLDFQNFSYTLVVSGLELLSDNGSGMQMYGAGVITIYEDTATAPDFGAASTFTDGTVILSGEVSSLNRGLFGSLGNAAGTVNWTGGSGLGDIAPSDRLGWSFFVVVSNRSTVTEPGYDENWDGKVEPSTPIVGAIERSLGEIKADYQD